MDYKEKLRQKASDFVRDREQVESTAPSDYAKRVQNLGEADESQRVVFQSVAVTALQLIDRVRRCNDEAAQAAISLGQRERLEKMETVLNQTSEALRSALSEQGEQMLVLCETESVSAENDGSWWFALTESIELLEDGTQQMLSLAEGQPEDSTARQLGECIAHLFDEQHTELLIEADQWIS